MQKRLPVLGTRLFLALLVLSAAIPMAGVAFYAVMNTGQRYRDTASARLLDTASTLALAVENELRTTARLASAVSLMAHRRKTSLDEIDDGARERIWGSSSELIDAADPRGALLPQDAVRAATANRDGMTVSNLFNLGPESPNRIAIIIQPPEAHTPVAVVAPAGALVQLLHRRKAEQPGLLLAVTDGEGRIVARSRDAERFIGKPVPHWQRLLDMRSSAGLFEAQTHEGSSVMFAFRKIEGAPGWTVVVGEPLDVFRSRWRDPTQMLTLGAAVACLVALLGALFLARRFSAALAGLARSAKSIASEADQKPVALPHFYVREFENLRAALERSAASLREKEARAHTHHVELEQQTRRYRAITSVGALLMWQADAEGRVLAAQGWQSLTGEPERRALGRRWLTRVHKEDLIALCATLAGESAANGSLDAEFRVRGAKDEWHWVRLRGARLVDADGHVEWTGVVENIELRRKAMERIAHMAHHDSLTGLLNRARLTELLKECFVARTWRGALLLIDLDQFKAVNDTLGHTIGDDLLRVIAARFEQLAPPDAAIARLGGDEFALLLRDPVTPAQASGLAQQIVEATCMPVYIAELSLSVGASIGVAMADASDADAGALLRRADLALYEAKAKGRGRFALYHTELGDKAAARMRLEQDLRNAVGSAQFELHYQPIYNLASREIVSLEALLRWRHPERGMISPAEFIPIAEEIGLIEVIGAWALREACHAATRWPAHVRVAVNVSSRQFAHGDFAEIVSDALAATRLPADRLDLEITESILMDNVERAAATMLRLTALGCHIALDDFGTGYSSLSYLRSFRFDKVKIDRSFVANVDQAADGGALLRSILEMCAALGLTTVAEGVEKNEEANVLSKLGCTQVQGYLFARPQPRAQIDALFGASQPEPRSARAM